MSSVATMLRTRARRRGTIDLAPAMTQEIHAFRPRHSPIERRASRALPVIWPTQCRDCWGWVDDPRHLVPMPNKPLEPR